jgi:hypothetical protein
MRTLIAVGIFATVMLCGHDAEAQAPPAGEASPASSPLHRALLPMAERLDAELGGPAYGGLDPTEKHVVAYLAINAVVISDSGQCAIPSDQREPAQSFFSGFAAKTRGAFQPVAALPEARKTELLDTAMQLASQQPPDPQRVAALCHGSIKPGWAAQPADQARTRQLLQLALSPPVAAGR